MVSRAILMVDIGFYICIYIYIYIYICRDYTITTKAFMWDPCPVGLPTTLTVEGAVLNSCRRSADRLRSIPFLNEGLLDGFGSYAL